MVGSGGQEQVEFGQLNVGDRVEVEHRVTVGVRSWTVTVSGKVLWTERRGQGLHFARSADEKNYVDLIVLERPNGERTTLVLDEFTKIRRI